MEKKVFIINWFISVVNGSYIRFEYFFWKFNGVNKGIIVVVWFEGVNEIMGC